MRLAGQGHLHASGGTYQTTFPVKCLLHLFGIIHEKSEHKEVLDIQTYTKHSSTFSVSLKERFAIIIVSEYVMKWFQELFLKSHCLIKSLPQYQCLPRFLVSTDSRSQSPAKQEHLQSRETNRISRKVNRVGGGIPAIRSPGSASYLHRSPRFKVLVNFCSVFHFFCRI